MTDQAALRAARMKVREAAAVSRHTREQARIAAEAEAALRRELASLEHHLSDGRDDDLDVELVEDAA